MSTPELNKALVKFHGALEGNIKKQSQAHQYKYADLGSTLDVIREPLAAAELAVTQTTACYRDTSPPTSVLITTLLHSSGEEISSEFYLDLEAQSLKNANPMQNIGSTITYTRRYALQAILNLASEDDDGVSSTARPPKQQAKAEPKEIFVPGEDPPFNLPEKYDTAKTLLKFVEQAKEEIAEIAFPGRLMAWKKDNNTMLGRLQKAHPDKFEEVRAAYKTQEENLKGK
tara:strand:+ start:2618 stop:3304 length:687 start_codon:yes stop_codon:yes gene_type:complete